MTYQWFYFDLISKDDLMIVVIFHGRPYFLSFDISILDICIYQGGLKKQYGYTQPAGESVFEKSPVRVSVSQSHLIKYDDHYIINIDEKDIQMQLELKPSFDHWKPFEIPLYKSEKYYFNWQIYSPYLHVTGYFSTDGKKTSVEGRGYLDYNEGNYLFNKFLKSWIWGRFYSSVDVFIFGSLCFKNNEIYQPAIYVDLQNSRIFELAKSVKFDGLKIEIPASDFREGFQIEKFDRIDSVKLLMSKIPESMRFFRKVHEYSFDRLNRTKFGRKITPAFVNINYDRFKTTSCLDNASSYQGILETMKFF
jgi:hypothetical protein